MNIDLRTCLRALVLSHLDRFSNEAISIEMTVRSDIWLVEEHLKTFGDSVDDDDFEQPSEAFGLATIRIVVTRPSNYTKVFRTYSVRGYKDPFEMPMQLVADHDSCWIEGALEAVKHATKKATEMAIEEARSLTKSEFHSMYENARPHVHHNIENCKRCVIKGVESKDNGIGSEVTLDIGPSEHKTRFI